MNVLNLITHLKAPSAPHINNGITVGTTDTRISMSDFIKLDFSDLVNANIEARFDDGTRHTLTFADANSFGFMRLNAPILEKLSAFRTWTVPFGIQGSVYAYALLSNGIIQGPSKYSPPMECYITGISVNWEYSPTSAYVIEYSIDGGAWVQAGSYGASADDVSTQLTTPVRISAGSYIQFRCDKPGQGLVVNAMLSTWG